MVKHPCSCCTKTVRGNQKGLLCTGCKLWTHISCGRVSKKQYDDRRELFQNWLCPKCVFEILPFSGENSIVLEQLNDDNCNKPSSMKHSANGLSPNVATEFPEEKGIKIAHLNIRSLKNKTADLTLFLKTNPFDFLSLSETWLNTDIPNNEVSIDGYKFERLDRNSLGGGVGCYINNKHLYMRRKDLESSNFELMWLEIKRLNSNSLFVGIIYRKPNAEASYFDGLEENIDKVYSISNNVLVLGDFNSNMSTNNVLSKRINDFCIGTSMTQLIKEPTRITPHSSTLIDLILVSNTIPVARSGVQCVGFSDHSLVFLVIKGKCPSLLPKISTFRSFRAFDEEKFKEDLSQTDWTEFYSKENDLEGMWECFRSIFLSLSDNHAPVKTVRRKRFGVPWITEEYIQIAREREYYRKKFKTSKLNSDWENFKKFRNRANNLNKRLKREYFQGEFIKCGNDVNKNWKIIKNLLPNKKSEDEIKLVVNEELITDTEKIVNTLNEEFNNVSERLKTHSSCNLDVNAMKTLPSNVKDFKFMEISDEFVKEELRNIDCKKAVGLDGLHPKLLKIGADLISEPLTFLFNRSLQTSDIPLDFITARISPIHKGGTHEVNNYRPISVLPVLSKILEKAVHKQLFDHLNKNKLLSSQQSGFRPSHSTATCVTEIVDYLLENMNKRQLTGAVFLDLKKAFDVIPHRKILRKLSYYGINMKELKWFENYLIGRRQCVSVSNCISDFLTVKSGVPQGSILGPLLFCLYINDMCNLRFHENTKISLYADDTALFNYDINVEKVQKNLQQDFDLISNWFENNDMYLHSGKTKVMMFGPKRKLHNKKLMVKYKNERLDNTESIKYLGVILDSQLLWNEHVAYIRNKLGRSIGCIRRIKHLLPQKIMINLYYSLILPHIDYCCTAWGTCSKTNLILIQRLQNKYARLVLNADWHTSQCYLMTTLNWQTVEKRIKYQYCLLVYKVLNNLAPSYLRNLIIRLNPIYTTRYSENSSLSVPHPRTEYKKRSFSYTGSFLFNKLPITVQQSLSLFAFKKKCQRYISML